MMNRVNFYKISGALAILLVFNSCTKESPEELIDHSFFVAGHTYGKPGSTEKGFHPPFKEDFNFIQTYPGITFGILTGDIVQHSSEESWDIIDNELEELGIPVYFAPGNHDVGNYNLYRQRYGDPDNNYRTYGNFEYGGNLYILLDANLDHWNISDDQLTFLKNILETREGNINNVFIFIHQLIWWDEHTVFKNIVLNWPPYTPDTTNYWGVLEPAFQNYSNPIYLFAGDLGANDQAEPYLYYEDNNITYVAGGMGGGADDNYLFVRIDEFGVVNFSIIALQGERGRFGRIEDYILP